MDVRPLHRSARAEPVPPESLVVDAATRDVQPVDRADISTRASAPDRPPGPLAVLADLWRQLLAWLGFAASPTAANHDPASQTRARRDAVGAPSPDSPESLRGPQPLGRAPLFSGRTLTLAAVGDIQTGSAYPAARAAHRLPPDGGEGYFDAVAPWIREADLALGNLEQVIADQGESAKCSPGSTRCYAFRVPESHASLLSEAGFDVVSIANNHAGDFGPEGRAATMEALDRVGIDYSGPVGVVASRRVNGLRVGMVAFSTGPVSPRIQDIPGAERLVREVDQDHDIVVVSFHGGAEGSGARRVPFEEERFYGSSRGDVSRFARSMVDAGADMVFGHGPHVLRGAEVYRDRFIAYSLGNFSSYNTFNLRGPNGRSVIAQVRLDADGEALEARLIPLRLEGPGRPVLDPEAAGIEDVRSLSALDFGDALFDENGIWRRSQG